MDRSKLPYRKNCEGYFFLGERVLALPRQGYIEFPGGGIDKGESAKEAILREAKEECGAKIKNLKEIKTIFFDWDKNWAKTEKQKDRYEKFRGEEMHLFVGEVESLEEPKGDENEKGWQGERLIGIAELIKLIEKNTPFPKNMQEYYQMQLNVLREKYK